MVKKGLLALSLALIITVISVNAQEYQEEYQKNEDGNKAIEFHLNFMKFGAGINMPFKGVNMVEFSIDLLTLGIEHNGTSLGVLFSPFNFYWWIGENVDFNSNNDSNPLATEAIFSFVNFTLYWNIMKFFGIDEKFNIGPFAAINCVFMGEELYTDRFIFSAGIQAAIRSHRGKMIFSPFALQVGLRIIEDDKKIFVGIKAGF